MLQWIPTFSCSKTSKCHVGYVPRLTSNISFCCFDFKASSEYTNNKAFNAFKGEGHGEEWISNIHSNFWLRIECPTPVRIWKVGLRGRTKNTERIYDWRIEGGNEQVFFTGLYTAPNPTYLGDTYQEFLMDSIGKFKFYRIVCIRGEAGKPGLSTMQLFAYDD